MQTAYPDVFELFRERPILLKELEQFTQQPPETQLATITTYKDIPFVSSLFSNSVIINLLSMQADDPLALFADLAPSDLRAFFSLAAQLPQTQQEKPVSAPEQEPTKSVVASPEDVQAVSGENVIISGNVVESVQVYGDTYSRSQPLASIRQIPPPSRDFTGRERELNQAQELIAKGRNLLLVTGMGGVGKTTFAIYLADLIKGKFPEVQFYLNLRGNTSSGLSSLDVMRTVIHTFSPDTVIPENQNDILAIYRSLIDKKPGLFVFDDVISEKDTLPFLPYNRDSVVIITSRDKQIISQAAIIDLDVFSENEAVKLLLSISPRIGEHAQAIARLCGYLPLAIRLAGSFLAERIDLSPKDYIERLEKDIQNLNIDGSSENPLYASIGVSYGFLSADQIEIFKPMSIFEGKFTLDDISGVTGVDKNIISPTLDRLIKYSFIEWNVESSRYYIHPLIKLFVVRQMKEGTKYSAQQRHATYYLNVLKGLHEKYILGGESILESLRLFDLEQENIFGAQKWCSENMGRGKEIMELCLNFGLAAPYIIEIRVAAPETLRWLQTSILASRGINDISSEAMLLRLVGGVYYNTGDSQKAIEYYENSLALSTKSGNKQIQGNVLTNIGSAYATLKDTDKALGYFQKSLKLIREIGDKYSEGYTLSNIGRTYAEINNFDQAIKNLNMAMEIHQELDDRRGLGFTMFNLGVVYTKLGDLTQAVGLFEKALNIQQELGDIQNEVNTLIYFGEVYVALSELENGLECLVQALQLAQEIGNARLVTNIQNKVDDLKNLIAVRQSNGNGSA